VRSLAEIFISYTWGTSSLWEMEWDCFCINWKNSVLQQFVCDSAVLSKKNSFKLEVLPFPR
jgi:hypothetical protein